MSSSRGCTFDLGQAAYEAYADQVDWTTYDGQRIHPWDEQAEDRRAGWSAAAAAVVSSVKVSIAVALLETIPADVRAEALAAVQQHVAVAPTPGCSRALLPEARSSCTCGAGDGCSACLVPAELVVPAAGSGDVEAADAVVSSAASGDVEPIDAAVSPAAEGDGAPAVEALATGGYIPACTEREAAGCSGTEGAAGDYSAAGAEAGECPAGTRVVTVGGEDSGEAP